MRHIISTFLVFGVLFICSSCSVRQYQVLFEKKNALSDTLEKNKTSVTNYRIKPQDLIQIRNLQNSKSIVDINPGSSGSAAAAGTSAQGETLTVEDDGTIPLTGLGRVQVAGLTRIDAQKMIEELYRKTLLKDPIIDLKINNLKVTIFGEAKAQGSFPLTRDRTTLVEMLGEAGGLSERANESNIKIIRGTQKTPQVIEVDLSDIQSINDPRAVLQNGDIIYIAQNKRAVRNDKISNFSSIFQPALLLFNTALIIVTLIRH